MKLTYKAQMILSFILVILGNILTDVFDFWIYRSIAFIICLHLRKRLPTHTQSTPHRS